MSAVDILTPDPATAAARAAITAALQDYVGALGTTPTDVDTAAQALLTAIEVAPAGTLREAARADMDRSAAAAHLTLQLGGALPGVPGNDLAASLAVTAAALSTRALNGGTL